MATAPAQRKAAERQRRQKSGQKQVAVWLSEESQAAIEKSGMTAEQAINAALAQWNEAK